MKPPLGSSPGGGFSIYPSFDTVVKIIPIGYKMTSKQQIYILKGIKIRKKLTFSSSTLGGGVIFSSIKDEQFKNP